MSVCKKGTKICDCKTKFGF